MVEVTTQAIVVGVASIVGTALTTIMMSIISSKQKRKDRQQQWDRDDAVAKQVADAARLLVDSNAKVTANAKEVQGQLVSLTEVTDKVYKLTNHAMTVQIQELLDSKVREVIAHEALIALQKDRKIEPPPDAVGIIEATKKQIEELRVQIADRKKQQEVIDANKLTVTMTIPKDKESVVDVQHPSSET